MKKWNILLATSFVTSVVVAPVADASTNYYIVQKGDTLNNIATQYSVSVNNLMEWNTLSSNTIFVDQKLIIKRSSSIDASATTKIEASTSSIVKTYKVVSGDTLSKIATKNNTTVAHLKKWNGLTSDLIKINQLLIVSKATDLVSLTGAAEETSSTGSTSSNNSSSSPSSTDTSSTSATDAAIAKQLASEKVITKNPSAAGLAKYSTVVKEAKKYIGIPYVFGGNTPAGFDCSGFISYVFNASGVNITRKSALDYFMTDTTTVKEPVVGDLVFFKNTYIATISHIGIYIGNNEMIHAGSNGVEITKLSYKYWTDRQVAFKRLKQLP